MIHQLINTRWSRRVHIRERRDIRFLAITRFERVGFRSAETSSHVSCGPTIT